MLAAVVIAMSEADGTLRSFVGLNCALLRMTASARKQGAQKEMRGHAGSAMDMGEGLLVVERARHAVPLLSTSARNERWRQ
jgi:hypothetical protein